MVTAPVAAPPFFAEPSLTSTCSLKGDALLMYKEICVHGLAAVVVKCRKAGVEAMRGSDRERQQLIDRLKTITNPVEREKILWALEGMRKESYQPEPSAKGPEKASPVPPAEKMKIPLEMPKGLSQLTRYALPFFFIVFGFAFILQGVVKGIEQNDFASESGQFITGIVFIFFGVSAFQRARKIARMPKGTQESE